MTYFRAELVQLIISRSVSELEVQSIKLRKCTGQLVRQWTSHAVCVVSLASTFRRVYLVYVAA